MAALSSADGETGRIEVPSDSRDLPGEFRFRRPIDVRFSDTDAMGHVNNASYLTYCEIARAAYYEAVTGEPLPLGVHGASEGMILAEARITFRTPAFYGETLVIESRVGRIGRTSYVQEFRLTAPDSRYGRSRLIAVSESTQVMYDYAAERPIPVSPDLAAAMERFEGRALR
jgi:acyl-CoA thioester hydrolase